jgi:cellulose synthase/poly-beta-1,6-N-acetylglucosamine synthase-like glycosyltransferase
MASLEWLFWLAATTLVLTLLAEIELYIGNRSVEALRDVPADIPANPARVSIIVAARNKQRNIRSALQSLLALNYRHLQPPS